jgi:hypothetical protein
VEQIGSVNEIYYKPQAALLPIYRRNKYVEAEVLASDDLLD